MSQQIMERKSGAAKWWLLSIVLVGIAGSLLFLDEEPPTFINVQFQVHDGRCMTKWFTFDDATWVMDGTAPEAVWPRPVQRGTLMIAGDGETAGFRGSDGIELDFVRVESVFDTLECIPVPGGPGVWNFGWSRSSA